MVGNKAELDEQREITFDRAIEFAKSHVFKGALKHQPRQDFLLRKSSHVLGKIFIRTWSAKKLLKTKPQLILGSVKPPKPVVTA